ncbi:MAG: peptide chain release factor N(5)-glutamine methyltransferase [Bacteroidales bacterium]|nr:peptide chain release factor N(5)-glutamine methyltransferase [Bacteroidales bacterium]
MRDVEGRFRSVLQPLYGEGETQSMFLLLCEAFLGWSTTDYLLRRSENINQSDLLKFHWAIEDLRKYRPIQHVIGYAYFCGCKIKVSPAVLIPRPETEEIVQKIIVGRLPLGGAILDLCTGSGCIAIALKKAFPDARVVAVDVSPEALAVAQENALENGADVQFILSDVLSPCFPDFQLPACGLIVCNPPYVLEKERAKMEHNVLDYEPALALFVPDEDPLRYYRAVVNFAKEYLCPKGRLYFEINETQGADTVRLLQGASFSAVELHRDFRGKDRCVEAMLIPSGGCR